LTLQALPVLLTLGAAQNFVAIYDYIAALDSTKSAGYVLDRLLTTAEQLATVPEGGSYPKELLALRIKVYRQVFFNPYRVIYRVIERGVLAFVIADGRRAM
jgi:toxin ParE1/3/4